jgi:hypothetical protein
MIWLAVAAALTINEGTVAKNEGDAGGATKVTASAGKVEVSGGKWHWTMDADDGPMTKTITISGLPHPVSFDVIVKNVAPSAVFDASVRGTSVKLSFSKPDDASHADRGAGMRYGWSCHGEKPAESYKLAMSYRSWTCTYDTLGRKFVVGRVWDKDGGYSDYKRIVDVK